MKRLRRLWFALALSLAACGGPPHAAEPPAPLPAEGSGSAPVLVETSRSQVLDHSRAVVPVSAEDPQIGDSAAPVTIVLFGDIECPFTARVAPTMVKIFETYGPHRVRLVSKHYPLPFHQRARPAAVAAATVFGLSGSAAAFEFYQLALGDQANLTDERFAAWAAKVGVPARAYADAMASKRFESKVDTDLALVARLGVSGTPEFRINGVTVSGAQAFDHFKEVIDRQLEEAGKLVQAGTDPADVYVALTNKNVGTVEAPKRAAAEPVEDTSVWKLPVLADDPVRGPADALVTIVMFSDFQCPFCKRVEETLTRVLDAHPNDVRIVWKDNPLPFHARARPSALLARHAFEKHGNAGFWKAHAAIFESQPKLEDDDLKQIATTVGLSWPVVARAIAKNQSKKIDASQELADDFAARGTPHFFINGVRLSGAQPFEEFERVIGERLEEAKALLATGVARPKIYDAILKTARDPVAPERKEPPTVDAASPWKGGAKAKVVIHMWSEFQCPFCKRVPPTLDALEKEFGTKLKIVWHHMPLPFHAQAPLAAEAAEEMLAQRGQRGFWRYHDALFEAQGTPDGLERENLEKLAAAAGADMPRFRAALDQRKHQARVEADAALGQQLGISGTPNFLINGYVLSGAQPITAFRRLILRALNEAPRP